MLKLHNVQLKKVCDSDGRVIDGLWQAEIVRFERVGDLWECQVPMRQIGDANYFEFRPVSMGGHWMTIGKYRTRAGGCITAERLQAGSHVLVGGRVFDGEQTPRFVKEWDAEIVAEIARR